MKTYTGRSGRFAAQYDVIWIAAELSDILLNPFQGLSLITQSVVGLECRAAISEESVSADAVVDADHHDGLVTGGDETRAVHIGVGVCVEAPALDVKEDRQL